MSMIQEWLQQAGLGKFRSHFSGMKEEMFLNLLMQDYGRYGVTDQGDKHMLYKLIKSVRQQLGVAVDDIGGGHELPRGGRDAGARAQLEGHGGHHPGPLAGTADLLDLDAHDGDLLHHEAQGFQLSPMGPDAQQQAGEHGGEGAGCSPLGGDADPPKIRVVVRKRPITKKEKERGDDDIVEVVAGGSFVVVNETKVKVDLTKYLEKHQFNFDEALDELVSNDVVYRKTVAPLVHTLFENGKATCFAYGQTGSGKTYTMSPLPIRAAADILAYLARPQHAQVSLFVSCFEIYGNKCFDLLNMRQKLNILEDGKKKVVVVGLKEQHVSNVELVQQLIEEANHRRSVGSTAANADSSRSHSIMQFALKRLMGGGQHSRLVGKISFIDLAGSERGADTFDNNRQTRLEGAEINKSLLALKECIRALDCDARHVPFRGSKLTAVLRDSFLGDTARTVMIANISPTASCVEHTLNTLRYADRVKELRKDRGERTKGGVTPGDEDYYAAVERASGADGRAGEGGGGVATAGGGDGGSGVRASQLAGRDGGSLLLPQQQQYQQQRAPAYQQQRQQQQPPGGGPRAQRRSGGAGPAAARRSGAWGSPEDAYEGEAFEDDDEEEEEDQMLHARDELMDSILEDEEEIIALHRRQIEESMEIVRREMNMLAEVDQPGSAIDQYVDQLEAILAQKAEGIRQLQLRLERFKLKLQEEEVMSSTVKSKHEQQHRAQQRRG